MGNISAGFYSVMANDNTLKGLITTYNSRPAIFTTDPAPNDAVLPFIVCPPAYSDIPFDNFATSTGRELLRDIRCYAANTGSMATVESIAERVRTLFHQVKISVTGYTTALCWVQSMMYSPEQEDAYGIIVTVRLILE